jgi:glycerophosphoryl diester phosphodiesterase
VTAHRAAHQKYPENSLAAIKEAILMDVDFVELDVRETKDHALVLIHDDSIDRITNGKGLVKDLTLKEIQEKKLLFKGKLTDQRIITFSEALDVLKDKALINIDFKAGYGEALVRAYQLIKKKGMERQSFIYIYDHYELISKLQKNNSQMNIWPRAYSKADIDKILVFSNIKLIQIDFSFYEDKWAKSLIKRGIRISGNALGEYDNMQRENGTGYDQLIRKHINIIETDYPEELLIYLKSKGLHP